MKSAAVGLLWRSRARVAVRLRPGGDRRSRDSSVGSCSVVDRGDQRERTALPEAGFIDFIREIYKGFRASNLGL